MTPAVFLDSSAIVKLSMDELGSEWLRSEVRDRLELLFAVRVAGVEVVSAIARRRKSAQLSVETASRLIDQVWIEFEDQFNVMEVNPFLATFAMNIADIHGLRAYDAIQLAAAVEANDQRLFFGLSPLTFVSADRELNEAALREGLLVEDPNQHPSP